MCGRGQSCFSLFHCRSCCSPFLRWKQIANPARSMATEYLVRLRPNYEHPRGYLCCSLSDSRRDSFIICLIGASIECRTRKCVQQPLGWLAKATEFRERKRYSSWLWFRCSRLCLFLPYTPKSELRRWHNSLQRRSTRPNLFTDLNGRNRDSQGKGLFW